jgi:hypothetical protein
MIDDEADMVRNAERDDRALYYDYFKWVATLSFVAIGGVFSLITQSNLVFQPIDVIVVLACFGIAAGTGFVGVEIQISLARKPEKLEKRSRLLKNLALFALGAGAGYFVMMFTQKLLS